MKKENLTEKQEKMIDLYVKALPLLRKELKVSQTLLGKKIGKSRQMISMIERGEAPMTWETFLSIALFFKVNLYRDKLTMTDLDKFLLIDSKDDDN